MSTSDLPPLVCAGCTLCCHRTIIPVIPGEDPDSSTYETEIVNGAHVLAHKPDGDCVYLEVGGCGIYERRPVLCRMFDCRGLARQYSMKEWKIILKKKPQFADIKVVKQGRKLINGYRLAAKG